MNIFDKNTCFIAALEWLNIDHDNHPNTIYQLKFFELVTWKIQIKGKNIFKKN